MEGEGRGVGGEGQGVGGGGWEVGGEGEEGQLGQSRCPRTPPPPNTEDQAGPGCGLAGKRPPRPGPRRSPAADGWERLALIWAGATGDRLQPDLLALPTSVALDPPCALTCPGSPEAGGRGPGDTRRWARPAPALSSVPQSVVNPHLRPFFSLIVREVGGRETHRGRRDSGCAASHALGAGAGPSLPPRRCPPTGVKLAPFVRGLMPYPLSHSCGAAQHS